MSSEMRVTDAMVEAALDGLDNACMDIAKRELQPHDVLWRGFSRIRRMEAMRAALNAALLARTEAGADGAVAWGVEVDGGFDYVSTIMTSVENEAAFYGPENTIRIIPLYLHPQDASGDAEDARRYRWARDHVGGTAWNDDNFATVTIGVTVPKPRGTCAFDVTAEMLDAAIDAAMQAKEAK